MARELNKDNIECYTVHPGVIKTRMTGNRGDMGPDEAATRLIKLIDQLKAEDQFTFWHRDGQPLPW